MTDRPKNHQLRPGAVYSRDDHVVRVIDADWLEYRGRRYRALSAIANEITGGKENGFRWFRVPDGDRTVAVLRNQSRRSLRDAIADSVAQLRPMTVRQVYYRMVVEGLVPKDQQAGYRPVQQTLVELRKDGTVPYADIIDPSRRVYGLQCPGPREFDPDQHLRSRVESAIEGHTRSPWEFINEQIQIWCEKTALAALIAIETRQHRVPLYVSGGGASITYINDAAEAIVADGRPCTVYHFGDLDPGGVQIWYTLHRDLPARVEQLGGDPDSVTVQRIALTREHREELRDLGIEGRPSKQGGVTQAAYDYVGDVSIELDALHPNRLRELVRGCVEPHITREATDEAASRQKADRKAMRRIAARWMQ